MEKVIINDIPYTLSEIENLAWRKLINGAVKSRVPFHTPTFCSVREGMPNMRTVVLRKTYAQEKQLLIHSDKRCGKINEIQANPNVGFLFYDASARIQIRLWGTAEIISDGAFADERWQISTLSSRKCYLTTSSPGSASEKPHPGVPFEFLDCDPTELESRAGRTNFAVVRTTVLRMDWLYLKNDGNSRAIFEYDKNQVITNQYWSIP